MNYSDCPFGKITIWLKERLDNHNSSLLEKYVTHLNSRHQDFTLLIIPKNKKSLLIKIQTFLSIGFIPNEEVILDGFGGSIFPAGEAIIREFGGYVYLGVSATKDDFAFLKGTYKKIHTFSFDKYYPYIIKKTYFIIDAEFLAKYFNFKDYYAIHDLFSFSRFKQFMI